MEYYRFLSFLQIQFVLLFRHCDDLKGDVLSGCSEKVVLSKRENRNRKQTPDFPLEQNRGRPPQNTLFQNHHDHEYLIFSTVTLFSGIYDTLSGNFRILQLFDS